MREKARLNRQELIDLCRSWLGRNYYDVAREWAYKHIDPRILVEEYIDDGTGPDPIRYKLYTFHGSVGVIYVGAGIPGESRCSFYDRSWTRLPATVAGKTQIEGALDRPRHLDEMIRYAEVLADGVDFIRIDLYDTATKCTLESLRSPPEPAHPSTLRTSSIITSVAYGAAADPRTRDHTPSSRSVRKKPMTSSRLSIPSIWPSVITGS